MWRRRFYAYQTHLHGVFDLIRACHFVRFGPLSPRRCINTSVVWSYRCWYPVRCFLHWYGLRLFCRIPFGLWFPDAYGAGRGTGFDRYRQLSELCHGAFMAFGVAFEVPVAIVLLCWMGITTPEDLRKNGLISRRGIHCGDAAYAARCLLANVAGDTDVLPV